jgi:isoquinoline 1-oxidoreductase beta subunit
MDGNKKVPSPARRDFLQSSAAVSGGFVLGMYLPGSTAIAKAAPASYMPNAWVRIGDDNSITLISARSEMGQGVYTSGPMLIAEELNVDLTKVTVHIAPPNAKVYGNVMLGGAQLTGGSTAVREGWEKLRTAGAQVREMLLAAAAAEWKVDASKLTAKDGWITGGPGGKKATYGHFAAAAAKLPVPEKVALKDPKDFVIVGKPMKRLDTAMKVNGSATFGIDVKKPGMVYASIAQCPVIGGTVKSYDDSGAKGLPGVIAVVQVPDGVAVVADTWWHARSARDGLVIKWDEGAGAAIDDKSMLAGIRAGAAGDVPAVIKAVGDAEATIAKPGAKVVRAEYVQPMLSHSPLEPMNFTAHYHDGMMELTGAIQYQDGSVGAVAKALNIPPENITLETTFLGGGFGRRIDFDFLVQAAQIAKAVPGKPVKLVWTREDDMTHDFYRPMSVHWLAASLGPDGLPTAMSFKMRSQSVTERAFGLPPNVPDPFMAEAAIAPYNIPETKHEIIKHNGGLRVGYWRSVSHALNAFANESFIDELAAAAGKDPYEYRLAMLKDKPRFANVLKLAAERSGWGKPAPAGRFRGIALMEGYDTYIAEVAEISMKGLVPVVHRVTVAVDAGRIVNPNIANQQMESGVIFGLTAALYSEINVDKGRVVQNNFGQYKMVRMDTSPVVDAIFVDSTEKPGGLGEPSTSLIAAAVANAIFAATGKRVRQLPFSTDNVGNA